MKKWEWEQLKQLTPKEMSTLKTIKKNLKEIKKNCNKLCFLKPDIQERTYGLELALINIAELLSETKEKLDVFRNNGWLAANNYRSDGSYNIVDGKKILKDVIGAYFGWGETMRIQLFKTADEKLAPAARKAYYKRLRYLADQKLKSLEAENGSKS